MTSPIVHPKNKRFMLIFVLPLISCVLSSVVGVVIGQMGNLFYKVIGEAGSCLSLPGFCGLFLVTFGLSFLTNKLLRKLLIGSSR